MPHGKPASVRCVQLSDDDRCLLFGLPGRPEVCRSLQPTADMCRGSREEALAGLVALEELTRPRR